MLYSAQHRREAIRLRHEEGRLVREKMAAAKTEAARIAAEDAERVARKREERERETVTEGDRTLDALRSFDEEVARRQLEAAAHAAQRARVDAAAAKAKAKAKTAEMWEAQALAAAAAEAAEEADAASSAERGARGGDAAIGTATDGAADGIGGATGGDGASVGAEEREEEPPAESEDDAPLDPEAARAALLLRLQLSAAALQERAQKALGLGKDGKKPKRRRRSPRKSGNAARTAPPQFAARDAALAEPLRPSPALADLALSLLCLAQCTRSAAKQAAARTDAALLCERYAKALRCAEAARKYYTALFHYSLRCEHDGHAAGAFQDQGAVCAKLAKWLSADIEEAGGALVAHGSEGASASASASASSDADDADAARSAASSASDVESESASESAGGGSADREASRKVRRRAPQGGSVSERSSTSAEESASGGPRGADDGGAAEENEEDCGVAEGDEARDEVRCGEQGCDEGGARGAAPAPRVETCAAAAAPLSSPRAAPGGEASPLKTKRRASRCLEATPRAALAWLSRSLSTRRRAALRRVVARVARSGGGEVAAGRSSSGAAARGDGSAAGAAVDEVLKNQAVQFLRLSRGRRRVAGHALVGALLARRDAAARVDARIDAANLIARGQAGDASHMLSAFHCAAAPRRAERSAKLQTQTPAPALSGRDAARADDGVRDRLSARLCYDHTADAGGTAQTPKGTAPAAAWTGHVSRRDALVAQLGARCGFFDFVVGMVAMRLDSDCALASLARTADVLRSDALRS